MKTLAIPQTLDTRNLDTSHAQGLKQHFQQQRDKLLVGLRCLPGLPGVIAKLNPKTTYQLVSHPEGARLVEKGANTVGGVFHDANGRIVEHAQFKRLGPSLTKAASAVGSQVLLVSIAMQLNRVEQKIDRLQQGLRDDRLATIESGVRQFESVLQMQQTTNRLMATNNAIQTLQNGLGQTYRDLAKQIEQLPSEQIGFWDNWFTRKSTQIQRQLATAEETFRLSLLGLKTLAGCYTLQGEPQAAADALQKGLTALDQTGIDKAVARARLVPARRGVYPEKVWQQLTGDQRQQLTDKMNLLAAGDQASLAISFRPEELKED